MTSIANAVRPSLSAGISNVAPPRRSGVLFVAHAGLKIVVFTPADTAGYFESLGFRAHLPIS